MLTIQQGVQNRASRLVRKLGLALARHWPWPVAARLTNGRRMYVDLRSGIGRGIFMKGEFDREVFGPLQQALKPGGTFLDVGSNVGFYSMLALDLIGPTGMIHAFEIDERPLRCLHKTIASEGLKNLALHEVAVGNREGTVSLMMREDSGNSSVAESGGLGRVEMTTLDAWWRKSGARSIQAIKLDIEGSELLALQGAHELLRTARPLLVCEADADLQAAFGCEPKQLLDYLSSLHYRVESLAGAWSPTVVAFPQ